MSNAEEGKKIKNRTISIKSDRLLDVKAYAGGDIIICHPNNVSVIFISYLLNSNFITRFRRRLGQGYSVVHIYASGLKTLKIPLPPLPEQKKIAEILTTLDSAIETLTKLIDTKKKLKKGLMQQLLTGKTRFKEFGKPAKDGELPEGWEENKLREVFERITRKNTENNTNVLTISAQQGFVNQEKYFNKQIASEKLTNYFLLKKGEFAYNKSYSNGYPLGAIKRLDNFDKGVVTTLYICFCLFPNRYSSDFIKFYFDAGPLNRGLVKIAHEGGRAHGLLNVTPNNFFGLQLKLPPTKEQTRIATVLTTADKEIEILNKKLEVLKQQKKGLMQVLLTGKVRVGPW